MTTALAGSLPIAKTTTENQGKRTHWLRHTNFPSWFATHMFSGSLEGVLSGPQMPLSTKLLFPTPSSRSTTSSAKDMYSQSSWKPFAQTPALARIRVVTKSFMTATSDSTVRLGMVGANGRQAYWNISGQGLRGVIGLYINQ